MFFYPPAMNRPPAVKADRQINCCIIRHILNATMRTVRALDTMGIGKGLSEASEDYFHKYNFLLGSPKSVDGPSNARSYYSFPVKVSSIEHAPSLIFSYTRTTMNLQAY